MYKELEVRRGIMLLDEKKPDWRDSFDPESLNMLYIGGCVLYQVFGGYTEGLDALGINYGGLEFEYGFDCDLQDDLRKDEFNETWKQLAKQPQASPVY